MTATDRSSRRETVSRTLPRRMRTQLRIFLAVFVVSLALTIERILAWDINPLWGLLGLAIGLLIGAVLARSKPLTWDTAEAQVAAGSTAMSVLLLALYLIFAIEKSDILGRWISDVQVVGVVAIAITCGVMLGRLLATFRGVRGLLEMVGLVAASPAE